MSLSKVLQFLVPKDKKFFPLFIEASDNLLVAAECLDVLMALEEMEERAEMIRKIKELEHKGDEITHNIYDELNKTFITPFDREDINTLAGTLDDVLDFINGTAQRIKLFKPKVFINDFKKMSVLIVAAAKEISLAIGELKNLKNPGKIKEACINLNSIENQADDIYHCAISEMFESETDAIELIKKREIILAMEKAIDLAEDVSDVLKRIIVKLA